MATSRLRVWPVRPLLRVLQVLFCLLLVLTAASCSSSAEQGGVPPQQSGGTPLVEPQDRMTITVSFIGSSGAEQNVAVNLRELRNQIAPSNEQAAFGYLFQQVDEDGSNNLVATDEYVGLYEVLTAAADKQGLTVNDIWHAGCTLEITVGLGQGEGYYESVYPLYLDFTWEKLTERERYFYPEAHSYDSLWTESEVSVPIVFALSAAQGGLRIPDGWTAGECLIDLLSEYNEFDLRSSEFAPQLLWGLSAEEDSDVVEYRFPTNIVKVRIIPPSDS